MHNWFTPTPFINKRLQTAQVKIGTLQLGSEHPVRVQSMANTSTSNVEASVQQAIEIIEAGGELVRFTVINTKDAEALNKIKTQLVEKGFNTPIVADVHFNPNLADIAAKYVDKVRINPGNYIDKRATFSEVDYTDAEYASELEKLETRFNQFLDICLKHKTAIRVGTNHGSLSDRIMSRYGDTPQGMVEATLEFLRICNSRNFENVVVSLKSSNTRIMVTAYRLLALRMQEEQMQYALHLGVTEAGAGEDGRIKSAVGIGALMHDGLGDTIRVSLTEHPKKEIPVAKTLVEHICSLTNNNIVYNNHSVNLNPYCFEKRITVPFIEKALVIADIATQAEINPIIIAEMGFIQNQETMVFERTDLAPDVIFAGEHIIPYSFSEYTTIVIDNKYWERRINTYPLFSLDEYLITENKSNIQNWVQINNEQLNGDVINLLNQDETVVLVAYSFQPNSVQDLRILINRLIEAKIKAPIVIQHTYTEFNLSDFQLKSAADSGVFFIDGIANGLWLKSTFGDSIKPIVETSFAILQASRTRITKTEYISCPGCGRTLFELEETLKKVKESTQHLKGLKIAVMGCIVNGPGEMADADFGYVGAGPGKVSLYKGKELVKRNIKTEHAVSELLKLIETKE